MKPSDTHTLFAMEINRDTRAADSDQPWVVFLDGEIADPTSDQELAQVLKRAFLSDEESAPAQAAQQIDALYEKEFLPSDPLMRFQDDKGMAGFLNNLYWFVTELALVIPYNHSGQDILVNILVELRKLPTKQFKIWNVCALSCWKSVGFYL